MSTILHRVVRGKSLGLETAAGKQRASCPSRPSQLDDLLLGGNFVIRMLPE